MNKIFIILGAFFGIPLFIVLMLIGWVWSSYNQLISQNQTVETAWSQVETQYQRRFYLVPNLVSATKGYLLQEQKVFGDIAEARTRYAGSLIGSEERVQATSQFEGALGRLLLVMENYPELKAVETFRALTDELAGTENRVLVARDRYNENVRIWNTIIKVFPKNIIAGMFGFQARDFFKADEGANKVPSVDLEIK